MRDGLSQILFKDLYLLRLRELRLLKTEFSIYWVELLSSIQFDSRIFEFHTGFKHLAFSK